MGLGFRAKVAYNRPKLRLYVLATSAMAYKNASIFHDVLAPTKVRGSVQGVCSLA